MLRCIVLLIRRFLVRVCLGVLRYSLISYFCSLISIHFRIFPLFIDLHLLSLIPMDLGGANVHVCLQQANSSSIRKGGRPWRQQINISFDVLQNMTIQKPHRGFLPPATPGAHPRPPGTPTALPHLVPGG